MPKFVASGKFQPSTLDTLIAKRGGGVVHAATLFDGSRVVSSDELTVQALEDAYASDGALDDMTATKFGVRVRTPETTPLAMQAVLYVALTESSGGPANTGAWGTTATVGSNITRGAAAGILTPAWASRTGWNSTGTTTGLDFGSGDTRYAFAGATSHGGAMWVRPSAVGATQYLMGRYASTGEGWRFTISPAGALSYTRANATTTSAGTTASTLSVGTAVHVGFAYDATLNRSRLFVNGLLVKSTTHTSVPSISTASQPMRVAAYSGSTATSFTGDFSDAVLCDYAIPDHWFRALWAAGQYTDA